MEKLQMFACTTFASKEGDFKDGKDVSRDKDAVFFFSKLPKFPIAKKNYAANDEWCFKYPNQVLPE
eukprot:UN09362